MNSINNNLNYKWILLIHQMNPQQTSERVKIWRRLQGIGALSIKKSVYILPFNNTTYEDFQWIYQEITSYGGDATIFKANTIEEYTDQEIIKQFQEQRNLEYDQIISEALDLRSQWNNYLQNKTPEDMLTKYLYTLEKLKKSLKEIISRDYFHSSKKDQSEEILANMLQMMKSGASTYFLNDQKKIYNLKDYQNRIWYTRKNIHIDRIASGWLIKRFIDPGAQFRFIKEDEKIINGVGFDLYEGEFTHIGEDCTFETLIKSFDLQHESLIQIAEIIHDIDLKDNKFSRVESEGINQVIRGLSLLFSNDDKLLNECMLLLDGLYKYYDKNHSLNNKEKIIYKL